MSLVSLLSANSSVMEVCQYFSAFTLLVQWWRCLTVVLTFAFNKIPFGMPENFDGANVPSAVAEPPSSGGDRCNHNRNRHSNNKKKTTKFKGACKELEGNVYEISSTSGDSFTKVNRNVAEFCARTVPFAGELRTAMINLQLEPLTPPAFPDV